MVNVHQFVLSAVAGLGAQKHLNDYAPTAEFTKSIAIVGAGDGGLAMLKTLLDFPNSTRGTWDITLFDQRHDVGGVWLPELHPVSPPDVPETPLYPLLKTNTPVPSMTYPGFPFAEGTPLYPRHEHIQRYLSQFARHYGLYPYMRFNHSVTSTVWVGNSTVGRWNITYEHSDGTGRRVGYKLADHLVVASGNNHYPHVVAWPGQDKWLEGAPGREILHSVYYRNPEKYTNKTVVVVGYGASGRDAVLQISAVARKVYLSLRSIPERWQEPIPEGVEIKPQISHFTRRGVVFNDSSSLEVDAILSATGYEVRVPFLSRGNALATDANIHSNETYTQGLTTNLRYLFPLYRHIVSLCPNHAPRALAFIGLPIFIANAPSDGAQSLLVAHMIANSSATPSRDDALRELATYEEYLRREGYDPYTRGHRLINGEGSDYQDGVVRLLKERGVIPNDGRPYVEQWRRDIEKYQYMKRGWKRVEELGVADEWLRGVRTETQWSDLMKRLDQWQKEYESSQ
ncbi:hypothetical protein HGRIS_008015 [Hohenbuehelia grisea]|uniref:FAD/NAD(P)-binding domain-containing protein n=1 Tax=Hohenbuehelia grisea TaxID=104357 RepID=A0ABR3J709_9AGAR